MLIYHWLAEQIESCNCRLWGFIQNEFYYVAFLVSLWCILEEFSLCRFVPKFPLNNINNKYDNHRQSQVWLPLIFDVSHYYHPFLSSLVVSLVSITYKTKLIFLNDIGSCISLRNTKTRKIILNYYAPCVIAESILGAQSKEKKYEQTEKKWYTYCWE